MMAQVLTDAVTLHRKPLAPPGAEFSRTGPGALDSVWASRLGSKRMPDWITYLITRHRNSISAAPLAGHYTVDDEGVPAQRVSLVEKGTLKGFRSAAFRFAPSTPRMVMDDCPSVWFEKRP